MYTLLGATAHFSLLNLHHFFICKPYIPNNCILIVESREYLRCKRLVTKKTSYHSPIFVLEVPNRNHCNIWGFRSSPESICWRKLLILLRLTTRSLRIRWAHLSGPLKLLGSAIQGQLGMGIIFERITHRLELFTLTDLFLKLHLFRLANSNLSSSKLRSRMPRECGRRNAIYPNSWCLSSQWRNVTRRWWIYKRPNYTELYCITSPFPVFQVLLNFKWKK